ncbi:MAG: zinc ribbon domain-containing protein [Coriobacteriales bacterium]|nr:zinc ribbon domain-containing protein [Coriobacteriales bacterium]
MAKGDFERKLVQFMAGRNGTDELGTCVLLLAFVLVIINLFVSNIVLSIIALVLMVYAWWRTMSRNLEARENENGVFCEYLGPLRPWIRNPPAAFAEARAYKHLKCPNCGQRVRVPRGKGKIRINCPQCHEKFEAKS